MQARAGLRMLGAGIAVQALMSATNLVIALLLIRRASNDQYGYYVLIATAVQFCIVLQGSFIQTPMVIRLTRADRTGRADLVGGLLRDQVRLVPWLVILPAAISAILGVTGHLQAERSALIILGSVAVATTLQREFFRMVLFAHRQQNQVLKADVVYSVLVIGGAAVSTLTPYPAAICMLCLALSSMVGRYLLAQILWRHESWNRNAPAGMFGRIFRQGSWSAVGGGMRFIGNQGYTYLVGAMLSVPAVAALAATRLPISPAATLSNGIGSLMLPTIASWNHNLVGRTVLRRVASSGLALGGALCSYLLLMWLTRDWIFAHALKKSFDARDSLLLLWSAIAVIVALRDQLMYFLTARGRFKLTSSVTVLSTIVSLTSSFAAMQMFGMIGAPLGILFGELLNFIGMIIFSLREASASPPAAEVTHA